MKRAHISGVIARDLFESLPEWTVAVDPGETVGMAVRSRALPIGMKYPSPEDHLMVLTLDPDRAHDEFAQFCLRASRAGVRPTLVIEEYRIYPDKAMVHAGKTVPTAECIGAFKYIARRMKCNVIEQASSVKQTTAAMLRTRGVVLQGKSEHAKDAELHMWYPVLRSKYKQPTGRKQKAS